MLGFGTAQVIAGSILLDSVLTAYCLTWYKTTGLLQKHFCGDSRRVHAHRISLLCNSAERILVRFFAASTCLPRAAEPLSIIIQEW